MWALARSRRRARGGVSERNDQIQYGVQRVQCISLTIRL